MSQATQIDPSPDRLGAIAQPPSSTKSQETSDHPVDQLSTQTPDRDGLWSTALVWKSFEFRQREKFVQLQQKQNRRNSTIKDSPFIPSTFQEFIDYRLGVLEEKIETLKTAIAAKEKRSEIWKTTSVTIMPAFGGKNLDKATAIMMRAIPHKDVSDISDVLDSRELEADAEFVATAEYRIGASLLKEL